MLRRASFDPKRPLVAAREFIFAGKPFKKGDPFPTDGFPLRLIRRQYEAHAVNHAEIDEVADEPIKMTGPKGGRYTITAPWLETPLVIRGKTNAEKALADLREEGAPLGWIDGGTEVEIEEAGGGWYAISAPWLDEPEKVQGREAAEARQREIHDAGAPAANGDPEAPEGVDGGEGGHTGDDVNPDKSESENAANGDDGDGSGTDDAGAAEGAGAGENAADDAEAGESTNDAPADA